jgi:hypothetical protein
LRKSVEGDTADNVSTGAENFCTINNTISFFHLMCGGSSFGAAMQKARLLTVTAGLALMGVSLSSLARADDFYFSFSNDNTIGNVSGTNSDGGDIWSCE